MARLVSHISYNINKFIYTYYLTLAILIAYPPESLIDKRSKIFN